MARNVIEKTYAGNLTTCEYQRGFASWLQSAVSAVPKVNPVKIIGFGTQATHMFDRTSKLAYLKTAPVQFPLRYLKNVKILERANIAEWGLLYGKSALRAEIVNQVRRRAGRILRRGLEPFAR